MRKRTLLVTHDIDNKYEKTIKDLVPDWEVIIGKDPAIWSPHIKDAEIIAGWKKEMAKMVFADTNLRWLQTWSAGINGLPLDDLAGN